MCKREDGEKKVHNRWNLLRKQHESKIRKTWAKGTIESMNNDKANKIQAIKLFITKRQAIKLFITKKKKTAHYRQESKCIKNKRRNQVLPRLASSGLGGRWSFCSIKTFERLLRRMVPTSNQSLNLLLCKGKHPFNFFSGLVGFPNGFGGLFINFTEFHRGVVANFSQGLFMSVLSFLSLPLSFSKPLSNSTLRFRSKQRAMS